MRTLRLLLAFVSLAAMSASATLDARQSAPADGSNAAVLVRDAYEAMYNLDFPEALTLARKSTTVAQNDPSTHRAVAGILWLQLLFSRGAVFTDYYLSGRLSQQQIALPKPPADIDAEFKREVERAIALATMQLKTSPRSVDARYELGTAYGLQASYLASVEGSMVSGFRTARRAFDAQEYVLEHAPNRVEAGLMAGTYRYVVATLPLTARMLAYVVGFGGGKERGIALIEAASRSQETYVDARVALLLVYAREGRHADALQVAHELRAQYPRNRLFTLEAASAAIRAGRAAEAESMLTHGLEAFDKDPRSKIPGERAFWLYKRAVARLALNRPADARADLTMALQNHPADWTGGRIHLQLGKLADLSSQRADALNEYRVAQTTCSVHRDPVCADEADRLMKKPYKN
jgi:tetratricopeptide (TPR) repeat protein